MGQTLTIYGVSEGYVYVFFVLFSFLQLLSLKLFANKKLKHIVSSEVSRNKANGRRVIPFCRKLYNYIEKILETQIDSITMFMGSNAHCRKDASSSQLKL